MRKVNFVLLLCIIALNAYVVVTPFLPQATFQVAKVFSSPKKVDTPEARAEISREGNRVIIPSINLEEVILFGSNEALVNKGVWHIPHSSLPDKGSNTVLVGHRFSYKNAAVFYHLDKVRVGEQIVVVHEGKLYTYKVNETKIVQPTDIYVEAATEEDILTIYTCHPLWSTRERLVVTAGLEAVE